MLTGQRGIRALVVATIGAAVLALGASASSASAGDSGSSPGGPHYLPGDTKAFPKEISCMKQYAKDPANNYVNYLPAIGAPEHTDAIHSGTNPCAQFTGAFNGPNTVLSATSKTTWQDIQFVVFDGPKAGYLQGGGLAGDSGQFVAKFNPSTGQQIWKTTLIDVNASSPVQWIAFGSMGIHKNGYLYAAAGPSIWKINRHTGAIVAHAVLPIQGMPATDANFDGFHIAPDARGTILMKTQTRPVGCPTQGNGAMTSCQAQYGPQPDTTVDAVDPTTLKTLASIKLNQEVTARPVVTKHNGKIYMYISGTSNLIRVIWNPATNTLTQDMSWAPPYLLPGQQVGDAPALLGDWVVANTNAAPASVPICGVAVNQDDPSKIQRLCPWGTTLPTGVGASESPGSFGVDPQNNMIYMQDLLVGGVYGVKLKQSTGKMTVAWSRPDWRTSDYFSLIGPPNQRVVINQYINPSFQPAQLEDNSWTEGVLWANAATGKTIAQSGYNPSTALGSLANIGYGGRVYMMGNNGTLYLYQPTPQ